MYSVEIADLSIENVDDVFRICSHSKLSDPIQKRGIRLKRRWLLEILENGPPTKIAYINGRPVAQILFYPETIIPFIRNPRKGVVKIHCVYNPFPTDRGKGIGTLLLKSLIEDCRRGMKILEGRKCTFIVAKPFETREGLSLSSFYSKLGFKKGRGELFLEISEEYKPRVEVEYEPLPEDKGKALIFYNPLCEYSYPFAVRVRGMLRNIEPALEVELIDEWLRPWESLKRGEHWLIVNAIPIKSFWTEKDAFKREVESALANG